MISYNIYFSMIKFIIKLFNKINIYEIYNVIYLLKTIKLNYIKLNYIKLINLYYHLVLIFFIIFSFYVGSYLILRSLEICIGPQDINTIKSTFIQKLPSMEDTLINYLKKIIDAAYITSVRI